MEQEYLENTEKKSMWGFHNKSEVHEAVAKFMIEVGYFDYAVDEIKEISFKQHSAILYDFIKNLPSTERNELIVRTYHMGSQYEKGLLLEEARAIFTFITKVGLIDDEECNRTITGNAYFHLGTISEKQGNEAEAEGKYRLALSYNSKHLLAAEKLALCQNQ